MIVLELSHLKMEVTVSEPCDVIRVGLAPEYLCELISKQPTHRNLRSSKLTLLVQPRSMMKTYEDCAFAVAAPRAWNDFPLSLRNIKDYI